MKFDKNYSNKLLTFEYWLYKLSLEEAYQKTKELRNPNIVKYFEYKKTKHYDFFKSFKDEKSILKCQMKILYSNTKIPENCFNKDFWLWRGFSEEEAKIKISEIQSTECFMKDIRNDI